MQELNPLQSVKLRFNTGRSVFCIPPSTEGFPPGFCSLLEGSKRRPAATKKSASVSLPPPLPCPRVALMGIRLLKGLLLVTSDKSTALGAGAAGLGNEDKSLC